MRLGRLWIAALLLAACDYDHSNFIDPEYEGEAEIVRDSVIQGTQVAFFIRFSEPQEIRPPFLWTSSSPNILWFQPPCIEGPDGAHVIEPCGEGVATAVGTGVVDVSARYFGPRAADSEVVYTRRVVVHP